MDKELAVKVENVSKTFKLPLEKHTSIKSSFINAFTRKRGYEDLQVLDDISFEVKKGEFFGIVGRNGSGKSTLLKLLAGIYSPTKGSIKIDGVLTPFIELGVGFNPELTGRENVYLNGSLLGFTRAEMDDMYEDIVAFAEIKRFMDQKLKNYSSGMQVRLAFSIAVRTQTDLLVLDEVLAVGDAAFQRKCYDYFMLLKKNKKTVILVTHDMSAVRQYCDRAIMIEDGKIVKEGMPNSIAQAYHRLFLPEEEAQEAAAKEEKGVDTRRWGTGKMSNEEPSIELHPDIIIITSKFKANTDLPPPLLGFTIYGPSGINVLEGNTQRDNYKTKAMKKGEVAQIKWVIPNIFSNGRYDVSVASCDQSVSEYYEWFNEAASFTISKDSFTAGAVDPVIKIEEYKLLQKAGKS